jgi:pSer/pThr/pTyr-binding forkhead associated (FHA) protein
MGFLRSIESSIEYVVDGTVGRVVRVSVQPVEIARKLAKELEDGKVEAGGRTLVPSQYTVYLPPKDRERFSEYEASLRVELGAYLAEHVRREGYSVRARPRVTFETAEELASGTFGIATEPETTPEPERRSIRVEPGLPIEPAPESLPAEPEPAVDALPDVLAAPGLEPDSEFGPADYEPGAGVEIEAERAADPLQQHAEVDGGAGLSPPSPPLPAPGFPSPAGPAGPAPFLPLPTPPVPEPPAPSVDVRPRPDLEPVPIPHALEPEPEPIAPAREPIAATQSVSAAEAARAGLAHAADALVVDGRRYALSGPVTVIGRSSACDVPLDDASASRRHAELRRRGGKTVLVDLDSTNGTLVNGRRVREAPLRPGDRITIGTTSIVFERAS